MPLAEAHEKFILKQLARGGETMAHGGLLHLEPGSGTRHAALFHQGGKGLFRFVNLSSLNEDFFFSIFFLLVRCIIDRKLYWPKKNCHLHLKW